jgi:hypothetical protein
MPSIKQYVAHTTSPIFLKLAYNLGSTERKQKYGQPEMEIWSNQDEIQINDKRMPSATVRGPYAFINTNFNPP